MDGKLTFVTPDDGRNCLFSFQVVSEQGQVMWSLEAKPQATDSPTPCGAGFPVRYGRVPWNLVAKIGAKPLQPGEVYAVTGNFGEYRGAFRYRVERLVTVQTLSRDDPKYGTAMSKANEASTVTYDAETAEIDQPTNTASASSVPRAVRP